ncbi:IS110 family transposase [soil metagenome]
MDGFILAIDLGKFSSVLCWYDATAKTTDFRTVKTTPNDLRRELTRHPVNRVVIEACAPSGWVHDLCESLGLTCEVANTAGAAWAWKNVKRKTDRDDALKLARLAALGELPTVAVPVKAVREWKSLLGLRKRLVSDRVRGQNRIRAVLVSQGLPAPVGSKAWTALGIAGLQQLAKPLTECGADELWRGELDVLLVRHRFLEEQIHAVEAKLDALAAAHADVRRLETIPGVGVRTAEVIAAHLGDAKRFRTANQVSAYAGLVPRQYQSGETDRHGRITKRGPKLLRTALVECAWCCLRWNAWALATWRRLLANGVCKKKAIVALARKLLIRCWGMLKRGEEWRGPLVTAAGPLPV